MSTAQKRSATSFTMFARAIPSPDPSDQAPPLKKRKLSQTHATSSCPPSATLDLSTPKLSAQPTQVIPTPPRDEHKGSDRSVESWVEEVRASSLGETPVIVLGLGRLHDLPPSTSSSWIEDLPPSTSSSYRDKVLEPNGIWVMANKDDPDLMERTVQELGLSIVHTKRDEPRPTETESKSLRALIWKLERDSEASVTHQFFSRLLPSTHAEDKRIRVDFNQEWTLSATPHPSSYIYPGVAAPTHNIQYSFADKSFDLLQSRILNHPYIKVHTQSHSKHYFPFLIFAEGFMTHAENQAAGAGAYATNSLRSFLQLALDREPLVTETVFFSCTMNAAMADIWIHWCEPGVEMDAFRSTRIERYVLERFDEVRNFQYAVSNIMDWAIEERLPSIKAAVSEITHLGGVTWLTREMAEA